MIRCDLHIHSAYSFDSMAKPEGIVDTAVKRGLSCIAIADHGNIKGSVEAAEYAKRNNLPVLIIISEEIKSKRGDILAFNLKEAIPNRLPVEETLGRIRQQGGMSAIAHPFGSFCGFEGNLGDYLGNFDAIEALNASVFNGNTAAQKFAQDHGLPITAGSDAHFANRFIGKTWLELPLDYSETLTAKEVLAAIKEKRGTLGGQPASFFDKAFDHSCRTLAKLKALTSQ